MPRTSKREDVTPPGSRRLNEVVARNMKARRLVGGLSQEGLALRMTALGHRWTDSTVSDVEKGGRNVTVDELGALALSLGALMTELLDPAGLTGDDETPVYVGAGETKKGELVAGRVLGARLARAWVRGRTRFAVTENDPLSWRIATAPAPLDLEGDVKAVAPGGLVSKRSRVAAAEGDA